MFSFQIYIHYPDGTLDVYISVLALYCIRHWKEIIVNKINGSNCPQNNIHRNLSKWGLRLEPLQFCNKYGHSKGHINEFISLVLCMSHKFHHKYIVESWKINVSFYKSNFICKYDSFYFQSVIFSSLFIVLVLTLILLVILNSNYWLCFIIIFYIYDSKIHFICAIPLIFRFLVLIVTSSHPVTVSLFFYQHNVVVSPSPLLIVFFLVSSLPRSVTTHSDRCLNSN